MSAGEFNFSHRLRVRWSEVDMQSVVFNGHYLTYFDIGFTEYWRLTGLPGPLEQARAGSELFARKATIEYHASARFDDLIDVYVRVARLGRSSMRMAIEIHRAEPGPSLFLVSGELVYVYVDTAKGRPESLPSAWRENFIARETTRIDEG